MNGIIKSIAVIAIISFCLSACGGESSGESSGVMPNGGTANLSQLSEEAKRGYALYNSAAQGCSSCHGAQGKGTSSASNPIDNDQTCMVCADVVGLTNYNTFAMPRAPYSPGACVGACASDVSAFIYEGFILDLLTYDNGGNNNPPTASLNLTGTNNFSTTEGANSSFTMSLATEPTDTVTIDFAINLPLEATMAQTSYSISPADWQTPVTVTVMGVDDNVLDPQAATTYSIAVTTSSNDADYNALTIPAISATNMDNELAGQGQFVFNQTMGLMTTEDAGSDSFTIALNTLPAQDVVVSLSSSNALEGTVNPATHTFNAGNYNTPQLFTVTGVNDTPPVIDGAIAYNIVVTATSTDRAYMGVRPIRCNGYQPR